jgi:spoIIIJ-associated protein
MKVYAYEGKSLEEAKNNALSELDLNEEEVLIKRKESEEAGLFKNKKSICQVIIKDEIINYIKDYINKIGELMGIKINIECKKREKYIKINLFTDNNAIIIGKRGKTIDALQKLIRQSIYINTGFLVNLILDVEDYKEKQYNNLEREVKIMAKKVISLKSEVKLDDMNSYARWIVHESLAEYEGVYTISEGEEPNRHIIIKPQETEEK